MAVNKKGTVQNKAAAKAAAKATDKKSAAAKAKATKPKPAAEELDDDIPAEDDVDLAAEDIDVGDDDEFNLDDEPAEEAEAEEPAEEPEAEEPESEPVDLDVVKAGCIQIAKAFKGVKGVDVSSLAKGLFQTFSEMVK